MTQTVPSTTRRRRMSLEQRRVQIVRQAIALFARHGFAGTTTQEIARRAGISEALLFRIFTDKRSLYSAIIDFKIMETGEGIFPYEAAAACRDEEVFSTIATVLMASVERDPAFMRLLLYSGLEKHQLADMFYQARVAKVYGFLESYIRKRVRMKAFRPVRADVIARAFVGMASNHMLHREITGFEKRRRPLKVIADSFVDLTLRGLGR